MVDHRNKDKKPFKIGQLVTANWRSDVALFVVLDIKWAFDDTGLSPSWEVNVLDQRTVTTIRLASYYFEPVGENDVKEAE